MATLSQFSTRIIFLVLVFNFGTRYVSSLCNECNPPVIPTPPETTCPTVAPSCPIATVELDACINVLGLVNVGIGIGIGTDPKAICCPVIQHLTDWEASQCLCSAVQAKGTLNINILYPKCQRVLVDCGKPPPTCFACPYVPPPTTTPPPVVHPTPPYVPPPVVKPPPPYIPPTPPPVVKPPPPYIPPTPPPVVKPPPPYIPPTPPPVVKPPPPYIPRTPPPVVKPPPPYIPPPTIPTPPETTCPTYRPACPIATVELDACIDVLGLVNIGIGIGIGRDPKSVCCPVLQRLSDWEAAECLCTAAKARATLNIDLLFPKCRRVCQDCGKPVPPCFQCQA